MGKRKIYWIGPRESDISAVDDLTFAGSLTIFGSGRNGNEAYCLLGGQDTRVNHNVADEDEDEWFRKRIDELASESPDNCFYFYNPNGAYFIKGLDATIAAHPQQFLCLNPRDLMAKANNKADFHHLLNQTAPLLDRKFNYHRANCDYASLLRDFPRSRTMVNPRFVFQAPVSSGGNGTYIVTRDNGPSVLNLLDPKVNYIVSIYEEDNIPVNIHAILFEDHILLSPGSVQIMQPDDNRLLYRGADFGAYMMIPEDKRRHFEEEVKKACAVFRDMGYRGVCGIDGIITPETIYLLEINNRFQASTCLINLASRDNPGIPTVQTLNLAAFSGPYDPKYDAFTTMKVNYSNYFYVDNGTSFHARRIHHIVDEARKQGKLAELSLVDVEDDGYDPNQPTNALAYLYRLTFSCGIASIDPDGKILLNQNVAEPDKFRWYDPLDPYLNQDPFMGEAKDVLDYCLRLKISLLTQGVVLSPEASELAKSIGGLREATNNAIDIRIDLPERPELNWPRHPYLIVNVPTDIPFVAFSPFDLIAEEGKLVLCYYGNPLFPVGTYPVDPITYKKEDGKEVSRKTKLGTDYSEIAFLSTDRLRVHLTNHCIFKKRGKGCTFCNIRPAHDVLKLEDIREVVAAYCAKARDIGLTHFLVGGQTAPEEDKDKIIDMIRIIREYAPYFPIYGMFIPYSEDTLKAMFAAGLNQLSCNVEVFDDEIARSWMPGKRCKEEGRGKDDYLRNLSFATRYLGRGGNVRTMVIVGLEPKKSLYAGIDEFTSAGIQPILSVFRPLPDTPMANMQAPSMLWIRDVYYELSDIAKVHRLRLGPACVNCQNNTLALPEWLEQSAETRRI